MRTISLFLLITGLLIAGCSSNSATQNPVQPLENENESITDTLPVIAPLNDNGIFNAVGMMGMYNLEINPDKMVAELTSKRSVTIGESYIVSGAGFFTMTPCHDCLKIDNVSLDIDGNIILGMSVKHPFPEGDPLKPPSAINRSDLDVFDLAVVVVPLDTSSQTYSLLGTEAYPGILVNADGYTADLSNVIDDPAICPYKICYEDENNNRFEMGTDYQPFDAIFSPGSGVTFDLYLTMGYGASAKNPNA